VFQVNRNILLVEPAYKTKFPPLGLMKISTYHKTLGDKVTFTKGISNDLAYEFWDRIYVSTVFTYNWNATVEAIKQCKMLVATDTSRLFVGGIMASLMPDKLWNDTGVVPKVGLLNYKGALDDDNDLIVERMVPDYNLFDNSPHKYSLVDDSYFGYSTRGCVNRCEFCGVHKLEPKFIEYKGIKQYVKKIKTKYGKKQNLILFDNNVLASGKFEKIINDIIELGFYKGSKFEYLNKSNVKSQRMRRVDFNQGTDARLMTNEKAKLLSKIALNPLRIAFDSIRYEKVYVNAIKLAAKHEILNLSNYILYNHKDSPQDFWKRLKINIDLNKQLGLKIYSFPMKYIPLYAKDRSFISEPNWNWYFVRGVQRILNVMKGSVMTSEDFFYRAFGEDPEQFEKILYMPEKILMYRSRVKGSEEKDWEQKFDKMSQGEKEEMLSILNTNRTRSSLINAVSQIKNSKIKDILEFYLPRDEANTLAEN